MYKTIHDFMDDFQKLFKSPVAQTKAKAITIITHTHGTYRLVPTVIGCGVFRCVQGKKCRAQVSPRRLSRNQRVAEAQSAQHPAFLPLFEQVQLAQAGQAGLQPLLVSTTLFFHGQRKRRQQKLGAAWFGRSHHLVPLRAPKSEKMMIEL